MFTAAARYIPLVGGEFRQGYGLKLSSGERIAKRFTANLEARYQRRPGERRRPR